MHGPPRAGPSDGVTDEILRHLAQIGVRAWALQDDFPDINCPLRVARRECLTSIPRFRAWHRYVPVLLRVYGFDVAQVPIRHFPRTAGRSKYGIHNRLWIGLRSLAVVRWLIRNRIHYEIEGENAER